jgi:hypothetical protein
LRQARQAIGGAALETLQTLTLTGEFQRVMGDADMTGRLTYELALPDKVRREEQMDTPMGEGPTLITAVNGADAWRDVENTAMGHATIMIRRPAGAGAADEGMPVRAEIQRLLAGVLADTRLLGLDATHAGQAQAADGTADVIDLKSPDGFAARLFVATDTHLPLMLAYKGVPVQTRMRTMRGGPGAAMHGGGPLAAASQAQAEATAAGAELPPPVDMQMFFGDHRKVDGLMLPARITIQAAGKPSEEWRITTVKANATIKSDRFVKKSKSHDE